MRREEEIRDGGRERGREGEWDEEKERGRVGGSERDRDIVRQRQRETE